MKYSEFLQLNEILQEKGTSLSKELGLNPINEADDANTPYGKEEKKATAPSDLETEKGGFFTKWGRIKSSLNKNAEKIQGNAVKQVEKYLPNVLKVERSITETLAEAIKQNKKGKELEKILAEKIKTTSKLQEKQLGAIYNLVDKLLNNADSTFDKKIGGAEKSKTVTALLDATAAFFKGGTDDAVLKLKNYWQVLHTQIQMNVYNYISTTIEKDAKEVLGENNEALKIYLANSPGAKSVDAKEAEVEKIANEKKEEVKNAEATATKGAAEVKEGEKYALKDQKDPTHTYNVEITKIAGDEITYKTDDGKQWKLSKDGFQKRSPQKIEIEKQNVEQTPEEKEKAREGGAKVDVKL